MIVVFKRKWLIVSLVIALAVVLVSSLLFNTIVTTTIGNIVNKNIPVYRVDTKGKVAITFDAAWGADKTTEIVNILKKFDVKATFFLVGFWIDKYPELVKEISDYGCDVGNHSLTHLDFTTLTKVQKENEIRTVNNKLNAITNKKVKFFRFPYGAYNLESVLIAEKEGLIPIQWSIDTLDWKGINKEDIIQRIKGKLQDGDIILFHNNSDHVLDALPIVIAYIKSEGYELVSLSDLVYLENYTIDANGVQHQNVI